MKLTHIQRDIRLILLVFVSLHALQASAIDASDEMFQINGKKTTFGDLQKRRPGPIYDLEKQIYELVEATARETYLESVYLKNAKDGTTVEAAREAYMRDRVKVDPKELEAAFEQFKDHPSLKTMPIAEQKAQISQYLESKEVKRIEDGLIQKAIADKKLVILMSEPTEPVFSLTVTKDDHVKYGPKETDIKPLGCEGDACPITIVEYSEFECPYCAKVLPDADRLMKDYQGKIRWIVRDFPLNFHPRAKPAAVAAKCAGDQGKFWHMYRELFDNQRSLQDSDFQKYAKAIGLNMKEFDKCYSNPELKEAIIDKNMRGGQALGVTGTPAFFVNGRRLSGALPYDAFAKVIEEELGKLPKK